MTRQEHSAPAPREQMSAMERLNLRVSAMINHPVAQMQRWVTIHRLDSDGQAEWAAMLDELAETPELTLSVNEDSTVTVRWARRQDPERDDPVDFTDDLEDQTPAAPF